MANLVDASPAADVARLGPDLSWLAWPLDPSAVAHAALSAPGSAAYLAVATAVAVLPRVGPRVPRLLVASAVVLYGLAHLVGLAALNSPAHGAGEVVRVVAVSLATSILACTVWRRTARASGPADIEAELRRVRALLAERMLRHTRELAASNTRLAAEIVERRRAEQGLRRTAALLARYVENTPLGVIEFELADPDEAGPAGPRWEVRRWSGQAEHIFGWNEAEALGRTAAELGLIVEEDLEQARAHGRVLASGADVRLRQVCRARRPGDGELRHCAWYSAAIRPEDNGGPRAALSLVEDITPRLRALEEVRHAARHDPLTGLPNRRLFRERLERALAAARGRGERAALLMVDLDRFKPVNDTHGHAAGDELLRAAALRLAGEVRSGDTVARLGGDEFALVQAGVGEPANAAALAGRLVAALRAPFAIEGHVVRIGASVGVAVFPDDAEDAETLLRRADRALYRAKADGRGRYHRYSRALEAAPAGLAAASALPAA